MKTHAICLTMAIILLCPYTSAQWVQTSGPYGASVTAMAVSGNGIFVGTGGFTNGGGVYRSTNNGANWIEVTNGLTNKWVNTVAVHSSEAGDTALFAGTMGGVFRSTDNGTNWSEVNAGLPEYQWVTSFADNGKYLFAGLHEYGLYRSTDDGLSWTWAGLDKGIKALAVTLDGAVLASIVGEGVFRSIDNGINWTEAYAGLSPGCFAIAPGAGGGTNLFAGIWLGGVFLSTNDGASWTDVSNGLSSRYVSSLAVGGTDLYAGTWDGGVFLSTNNGSSWRSIGCTNRAVSALAVGTDMTKGIKLFAAEAYGAGVFVWTNHDTLWTEVNNGLTHTSVLSFVLSPNTGDGTDLFAGTSNNGMFRSTDYGSTWTAVNNGLTNHQVNALAVLKDSTNGVSIFAGTSEGIFLSSDNGANWTNIFLWSAGMSNTFVYSLAVSGMNLFAGTYNDGVFLSTDKGTTWKEANEGLTRTGVQALAVSDTNLFAGGAGVFRSTNNGKSWTSLGMSNKTIRSLAATQSGLGETNLYAGTAREGVFLSTDGGINWTASNEGMLKTTDGNYFDVGALAVTGMNLFVGTMISNLDPSRRHHCNLFLSSNNGTCWTEVDSGLTPTEVFSLIIVPNNAGGATLIAGTSAAAWRRPLSEVITAVESSCELPREFVLRQNYPNPFNPSTTIKYELPKSSEVRLSIVDMLGREVSVLVNERKDAGVHEVRFDGLNLASGVYFYRMLAGDFVATKRMLVLK